MVNPKPASKHTVSDRIPVEAENECESNSFVVQPRRTSSFPWTRSHHVELIEFIRPNNVALRYLHLPVPHQQHKLELSLASLMLPPFPGTTSCADSASIVGNSTTRALRMPAKMQVRNDFWWCRFGQTI
eukprot:TRINITY_DN395_c0_g1_i15.p2 TRINITY_DN395_c0_g1~~TRINITY_DN395_c0_g1_i15.p2  ORF type:complete len:129 (-),score=16.77 TRINITY_DN395_c0_g1_i15:1115-1501(-)